MRITLQFEFFGKEIDVGYYILVGAVIYVIYLALSYIRDKKNGIENIFESLMMLIVMYFALVGLVHLFCYIQPLAEWLQMSCQNTASKWTFPIGSALILSVYSPLLGAWNDKRSPKNAKVAFHEGVSSKYDDVSLIKEDDLPKWVTLGEDSYCIQFEPKRDCKTTISIYPINIGIDDEGEINLVDTAMNPPEWKQKEDLQWPVQYQTGKVTF
jgi:hypothetical protein